MNINTSAFLKTALVVAAGTLIALSVGSCSKRGGSAGGGVGSGSAEGGPAAAKPVVAVSILPHSYFVRRIGGDYIDVLVLVGPGQSPHSYEPTPRQMAGLAGAKAWLLSNTDFELGLKPKIAALYPGLTLVDGTEGVSFRSLEAHDREGEEPGEHGEAEHEEGEDEHGDEEHGAEGSNIDRHTWLGKEPAKIFAKHVLETLATIDPDRKAEYEKNYAALIQEVDRTFEALSSDLASIKGSTIFVYHPSFGYFLDDFGLVQEAVETGGKEPSAKALEALIEAAKEDGARVIFVQTQFPTAAAKTVAGAVGAQVLPLDALAPDWLENIKSMGAALKKAASSVQ